MKNGSFIVTSYSFEGLKSKKAALKQPFKFGGEGGIRTPGTFDRSPDFKSGAFNRALPPLQVRRILIGEAVVVK